MFTTLTRRTLLAAAGALAFAGSLAAQEAREVVEMTMGAADAPVTLTEYASFGCPHCANFNLNVMPEIKAAYIDTGKVRLVYREVIPDRAVLWASMIARCAGPDRFFGIADLIYRNQTEWYVEDDPTVVAELYSIGRQAGMTDPQMSECLKDGAFAQALVAEYQKNVEADSIQSTPSFIMNGEKLSNMPWPEFQSRIEAALAG